MTPITADPASLAEHIEELAATTGYLAEELKVPTAMAMKFYRSLLGDATVTFKQAVTDEILASQRATNEALAAALNMRGVKE